MAYRQRPHVYIPAGAAPPANPSPAAHEQPVSPINLWADRRYPQYSPYTPSTSITVNAAYHGPRISLDVPGRPPSRASSAYEMDTSRMSFPEPQLYRSSSQRSIHRFANHRSTRSESVLSPDSMVTSASLLTPTPSRFSFSEGSSYSGGSRPSSIQGTPEWAVRDLSSELSDLTIDSEEGLRKFQNGELPENDSEWYRLVPPEAREVLDKKEVQRQSVLFEIIKSEKDYVADLELVKEVFIDPIISTTPIHPARVKTFVREVFSNLENVLAHHKRMLGALFERQREQFPLVQSVADIILDTSLHFRDDYEKYIEHYPISEMRHRSEMRRNPRYQDFLQQCSQEPRVRRRDMITFLSRPVTRLPRLLLLLENAKKYTEPDHPDMDTIPLVTSILSEFIKSTQPGIEAAEEKVRFWSLCESLVYQKGEIVDLDLYDATRSLLHQGPLSRKYKAEMNFHWADLHVALLDNYLLLLKPDVRQTDRSFTITKHHVVSRPIPLDYLRLGMFDGPSENRRERADDGGSLGGTILDRVRPRYRQMFPLTIYHSANKLNRRYTLYAPSEAVREEWHDALQHALKLREIRQDGNMFFAPQTINDGFFKRIVNAVQYGPHSVGSHYTGQVTAVTKLATSTHKFIAVACSTGVFVGQRGDPSFRKVLNLANPTCLVTLPTVGKFLVLSDLGLYAYSLESVGRAALGYTSLQNLEASRERIASDVLFFRAGRIGQRLVVLYTAKKLLSVYLYAMEVVPVSETNSNPRRGQNGLWSFRSFGDPISISKDTHNITVLARHVVICSERNITVADPANLSLSKPMSMPDFSDGELSNNLPMMTLKSRCAASKPLGIVRFDNGKKEELLVVYDELGCYTDKYGVPTRSSGYLRWETKAASYAHRGEHLLLFSPEFIEVRAVRSGKLVQVLEGADIRRVDIGVLGAESDPATAAMYATRGEEDQGLVVDTIRELIETTELKTTRAADVPGMWDEFDVA